MDNNKRYKALADPLLADQIDQAAEDYIAHYTAQRERKQKRIYIAIIVGLIILAAALRFYNLGAAPFWYDEAFSDLATALPWPKMLQALIGDVHPPAHYVLLHWIQLLGLGGTWGLRLLSALFSTASVILAGYLAWMITKNKWIPIATMFVMATNPANLHYAQEARMYAMLQMLVLVGMIAIYQRRWILLGAAAGLVMLTHNYGLFYAASLGLVALVSAREHWRGWIPAFGLAGLIWLPWGFVLYRQMTHLQTAGYWIPEVTPGRVLRALNKLLFSFAMPNGMELGGMIIIGAALAYLSTWLARKLARNQSPDHWLPLLIMSALPLGLAILGSWIYRPILLFRPLIGSIPFALMLVVIVLYENLSSRGWMITAALLIPAMLALSYGYHTYNLINKSDNGEWIEPIREGWEPGDIVYSLNDSAALSMVHRAPDLTSYKMPDCPDQASLGALTSQTREALGIRELPIDQIEGRAWVVISVSPVSPKCEVAAAERFAADGEQVRKIHISEFVDAGIYLARE